MRLQIVAWLEDKRCERDWLLEKIAGATGAIVMLTDKVRIFPPWLRMAGEMVNPSSRSTKSSSNEVKA